MNTKKKRIITNDSSIEKKHKRLINSFRMSLIKSWNISSFHLMKRFYILCCFDSNRIMTYITIIFVCFFFSFPKRKKKNNGKRSLSFSLSLHFLWIFPSNCCDKLYIFLFELSPLSYAIYIFVFAFHNIYFYKHLLWSILPLNSITCSSFILFVWTISFRSLFKFLFVWKKKCVIKT